LLKFHFKFIPSFILLTLEIIIKPTQE